MKPTWSQSWNAIMEDKEIAQDKKRIRDEYYNKVMKELLRDVRKEKDKAHGEQFIRE